MRNRSSTLRSDFALRTNVSNNSAMPTYLDSVQAGSVKGSPGITNASYWRDKKDILFLSWSLL